MAFSDLCHIGKAYKTVENETDQSERIMEENSMVRDLITKILDETGPAEGSSSIQSPEKTIVSGLQSNYPKNDTINTSYIPPSYNTYQNNIYSFTQNDQNGFNNFNNIKNGFGNTNGFVNYPDNDVSALLGIDPVTDTSTDTVTPEQLNLLRLAAQEIGGAQFTTANKFDDKYYNFFEPNQRNSLPETNNMFGVTSFNRPNSLNLDMNYNSNYDFGGQRYTNSQDPNEILSYLSQLNVSQDRARDENMVNNMDFKMPMDLNGHYHSDFNKTKNNTEELNKVFYNNRNYQQQLPSTTANNNNNFYEIMSQVNDRSPLSQNFDFANAANTYKPNNGFHQTDYLPRRDMNQILGRDNFQSNGTTQIAEQRTNSRENIQQAALIRQNQELARQMNLLMRNRQPPATQLNVDVSFLHETNPFNIGNLLGPSPTVPPPVLPSPMLDLPLLAPFYAMRNMRGAATSSSILHGRLDACYEQWRQLERERKRTEARLALAYPGRAVSSSNSIPVPRLPPCPTRVDRLTVDMLREHTKVLTLMGKMETLRASVCVTHNKKPSKTEDSKITVLKRGQENVASEKESGIDLGNFDPSTWREDVRNLSEIAPHSEVESAMLSWRNAVGGVQAARRRELTPHHQHPHPHPHATRYTRNDPILQLADAVKQLSICARRARCAMWCDLTLTVALAPDHHHQHHHQPAATTASTTVPAHSPTTTTLTDICTNENSQQRSQPATPIKQPVQENTSPGSSKQNAVIENKDEKPAANETKTDNSKTTEATSKTTTTPANKQTDKQDKSRRNQYRKLNQGRNDFYQKNQRYDARFMHNRPPYHYLATGSIN